MTVMPYNDWVGGQNQFQDMHSLHPSYMFNAPEVTNEYNLLGDFLSNSLLDDGAMFQNQDIPGTYSDSTLMNSMNGIGMSEWLTATGAASTTSAKSCATGRHNSTTNLNCGQ